MDAVAAVSPFDIVSDMGDDIGSAGDGSTLQGTAPNDMPLLGGEMPVSLQGPRGGYLYVRIIEVGNVDGLRPQARCDTMCCGRACCQMASLHVTLSCPSLERTATTAHVAADTKRQCATFHEEVLIKTLNSCSVDMLTIGLRSRSMPLGEVTVPMRVAVSAALSMSTPPNPKGVRGHFSAAEEAAANTLPASAWLPVQRIHLRRPGTQLHTGVTVRSLPYVEMQMLHLVDNTLPRLDGTTPLMLAVENQQETLVRAYLSIDVAESLSQAEQSRCVTAAIERRFPRVLRLLLERIKPLHDHLLLAIRLQETEILEVLLQFGGSSLLHPDAFLCKARRGRHCGAGARAAVAASVARGEKFLTPLALACSSGHHKVVEALCVWAQREQVHLDPSAPLPREVAMPLGEASGAGDATSWWDQDERQYGAEDGPSYGDPPMVMAVRGSGNVSVKLHIVSTLARFGFSADARSPVDSWTALLAAVETGSLDLVQILLKRGARLSADKQLGYTPLHLACQMGHWHLVPSLTESMCGQHARVAEWGPSPQYVSLNLVDAYGRTALDIALLRYFASPLTGSGSVCDTTGRLPSSRNDGQKHVDVLREFLHGRPRSCVLWQEVVRGLRFLDALPSKKVGAQILGGNILGCTTLEPQQPAVPHGDLEDLLLAVQVLVRAGAKSRCFLQELLQPPSKGGAGADPDIDIREPFTLGPRIGSGISPLDVDDVIEGVTNGESPT